MNKLVAFLVFAFCAACDRDAVVEEQPEAPETPIRLEMIPVSAANNQLHIMDGSLLTKAIEQHSEGTLDLVAALKSDRMETVFVAATALLMAGDVKVPQPYLNEILRKLQGIIRELENSIPIGELGTGETNFQLILHRSALTSVRRLGFQNVD